MKRTLTLAALALLASCSQNAPVPALPHTPVTSAPTNVMSHTPTPRYVALPGQAAVAVNSDVDAAFDQQVAAYAGQGTAVQAPTTPVAPNVDITSTPTAPLPAVTTPAVPDVTAAVNDAASAAGAALNGAVADVTAAANAAMAPVADITAPTGGNMNYKVRITNDTPGRIFVEAQDAAGTIYPCGFMENGRTFTTPMENAAPIKGPITVVVRDPDQPGAPEIRRYKVDPPATDYNGKAVEVNILKGGRYMAGVNGQVYYSTPAPEEPMLPNTPAPAESAAPAPAPAPTPTPTPAS